MQGGIARGLSLHTCVLLCALSTACAFDASNALVEDPDDPDIGADASATGADVDAGDLPTSPDAGPPDPTCAFDAQDGLCDQGEPDSALDLDVDTTLDTDNDPRCRSFSQSGGPDRCLVLVDSFVLAEGAHFVAFGSRPLVVAAPGTIEINGDFDVSSRSDNGQIGAGANDSTCAALALPESDRGGAGGGAGGSFAELGGNGGDGDEDSSLGQDGIGAGGLAGAKVTLANELRGGCAGSRGGDENGGNLGGVAGNGGGAVAFVSGADLIIGPNGVIRATGAGGFGGPEQTGGGGGGSGGLVRIEATNILFGGQIGANGGAGAEGGLRLNGNPVTGAWGADGELGSAAALGGSGAAISAGDGGDGSSSLSLQGQSGVGAIGGGGGGGGSAGSIHIRGNLSGPGQAFPAPIVAP